MFKYLHLEIFFLSLLLVHKCQASEDGSDIFGFNGTPHSDTALSTNKTVHEFFECDCTSPSICTGADNDTCSTNVACYSYTSYNEQGETLSEKGCLDDMDKKRLICVHSKKIAIICCETDFCNEGEMDMDQFSPDEDPKDDKHTLAIGITVSVFIMLVTCTLVALYAVHRCHKKRMIKMESFRKAGRMEGGLRATVVGDSTLADWMNTATSGSGSGLPFLIQRTMARQIELQDCIGRGRYGEVWKGSFQGETVAVKVFSSRDEQSWARETEIYNTVMLRHSNVLGYIGSDMTSKNSETEMWLVCYYHQYGSLYEFLQKRELDHRHALILALTAANGLAHLHTSIVGVRGKSAIAHRDIKSKNILVKNDLTCCVADLGLAVTHNQSDQTVNIPKNNHRVGTKRYMSPEVLDETINTLSFESFKQADVYSFALVLWEIMRRCTINGKADIAQPPYYDAVNYDPSFEEMRQVVAQDQYRPQKSDRWRNDEIITTVGKLMTESWSHSPSRRITIHRIKKTLQKCLDMATTDESPNDEYRPFM